LTTLAVPEAMSAPPRRRFRARRLALYLCLLVGVVITAMPVVYMLSTAVTPTSELRSWVPSHPTLGYFTQVFHKMPYGRDFLNSLLYAVGSNVLVVAVSTLCGFGLTRISFRGQRWLSWLVVALLLVPLQVEFLPLFLVIKHWPLAGGNDILGQHGHGLINNLWALILPAAASPLGIFLMRQFFLGLPTELDEAARVDGAGTWRIFWSVNLPLVRPAMAILSLLSFQFTWNNYMWPLIVASDSHVETLQLGVATFYSANQSAGLWQLYMAAAFITLVPLLVGFVFVQRYLTETFATVGLK